MKVDELKYVVGEAQEAKPVYMRFYGKIDEESTRCLLYTSPSPRDRG